MLPYETRQHRCRSDLIPWSFSTTKFLLSPLPIVREEHGFRTTLFVSFRLYAISNLMPPFALGHLLF